MTLDSVIIKMLNNRAGFDVTTADGAYRLWCDIVSATGEHLAVNTVKRLLGVLPYDGSPRRATLDIIARYLDYPSWQLLTAAVDQRISSFNASNPFLETPTLPVGQKLRLCWSPNRLIEISHRGDGVFEVIKSVNSRLREADILRLSQIAEGFPFVAKEVLRENESLGCYCAAESTGLDLIMPL